MAWSKRSFKILFQEGVDKKFGLVSEKKKNKP